MVFKLKNMTALLFGLIICSGILSTDSLALSCRSWPDVKQAFQRSDVVFHGKVISVDSPNEGQEGQHLISFEVIKSWGRVSVSETQVIMRNSKVIRMTFPRNPPQGAEFIVYAYVAEESTRNNPIYYTSLCGRGALSINSSKPRRRDPDKEKEELDRLKKERDERVKPNISWKPITSHDRACTADKAISSTWSYNGCHDIINDGWDGPKMVVIPAGGPGSKPFAIGVNEITRKDWNEYCTLSGNCESIVPFYEPMTNISWEDVEKYVQWLSERTGNIYRLPTTEEWKYAAIADGELPSGSANCQTALNGESTDVKSTHWFGITSGKIISGIRNNWGLQDYIGNVQEWVVSNDAEILAVGGHYNSDEEECDSHYLVEHNGKGDEVTGFRVLMEIQ